MFSDDELRVYVYFFIGTGWRAWVSRKYQWLCGARGKVPGHLGVLYRKKDGAAWLEHYGPEGYKVMIGPGEYGEYVLGEQLIYSYEIEDATAFQRSIAKAWEQGKLKPYSYLDALQWAVFRKNDCVCTYPVAEHFSPGIPTVMTPYELMKTLECLQDVASKEGAMSRVRETGRG